MGAVVCDTEQIIAVAETPKKDLLRKPLAPQLDELVQGKSQYTGTGENGLPVAQGMAPSAAAVFPVVSGGDPMGAVMLLKGERSPGKMGGEALESLRAAAMFLSRQLEV